MGRVPVLVADSQALFARSLSMTLEGAGDFDVFPENPVTGLDTIKLLADHASHCELVILDYWIEGMTGPATTRAIRRAPVSPCVVLTGGWYHGYVEVNEGFRAGAAAFVSKDARLADFLDVLRRLAFGDDFLYKVDGEAGVQRMPDPGILPGDEIWDRMKTLTVREIEVLSLLNFAPVEKVAKKLSISLGTLRNHIYNILRKTQTRSQIEALDIARRVGLIDS